ncbi:MAG: MBL fold metallo-hydrolase [Balneola sp.]|nr:MBL fold metallo-hydrolase [Balneola sp.]
MYFKQVFDKKLAQYAYIIGCQKNGEAIVIDPMRDIDQYQEITSSEGLKITHATDTHIHADYVSGLREFAEKGVKIIASDEGDKDWKYEWLNGSEYNYELVKNGDSFSIGNIKFDVIHTPGHTPESISFLVTDGALTDEPMGILTGDFVFVGDVGRPDLLETAAGEKGNMKPSAQTLYKSVEKFKELPEYLQVWPAHGSGSACGKALGAVPESTVGYETRFSPAFKAAKDEESFVDFILDGQPEPPLYFARMKKLNKVGPSVIGSPIELPKKVSIQEMVDNDITVVDTRAKHDFASSHLEGSIMASFDKNFNTIAGSFLDGEDEFYLIIDQDNLQEAVNDLANVGLDKCIGFATYNDLESWNGEIESTNSTDFEGLSKQMNNGNIQVLDVRKATEYSTGHIPGSINIAHTRLAANLDKIPQDKTIAVHCASGQRASYSISLLKSKGFDVIWVDDLFKNWKPEVKA